ncbi:glycosyltransferase family A protein [Brevibacillus porteri]|uniref:glycosyltransferase family A protein n=1 Tax=Brevibacillus porteri TaxID=2126350 RepID=UPI003D1FA58F
MLTSVIIPVRDAAHQLLYTLFSLNLQFADFEKYEVIVLDNGSTNGLAEKLTGFTCLTRESSRRKVNGSYL